MSHAITPNPRQLPAGQESLDVLAPFVSLWITPETHLTMDVSAADAEWLHTLADHARMLAYKVSLATRAAS